VGVVDVVGSHVSLVVPPYDLSFRLSRPFTMVTAPAGDLATILDANKQKMKFPTSQWM